MTTEQTSIDAHGNGLAALRLSRLPDGRTLATRDGQTWSVHVTSCFPWTAPGAYLSLRDDDDFEVALIPSLNDVTAENRAVLERALRDSAFAFEITHVTLVRKEFEIRHWDVQCVEGRRLFQTHVDDWPRILPPHGLLITDVAGDVYRIPDWTILDKQCRKQLRMFTE